MEIQYAMFFQHIDDTGTTLRNPINQLRVSNANHFQKIGLPLIITFFGGDKGKHLLNIHIRTRGSDTYDTTMDFRFDWPTDSTLYTKVFALEFKPKLHGIYDFLLEVDGKILSSIPLPIIQVAENIK